MISASTPDGADRPLRPVSTVCAGVRAVMAMGVMRERGQHRGAEVPVDPDHVVAVCRDHEALVTGWQVRPHPHRSRSVAHSCDRHAARLASGAHRARDGGAELTTVAARLPFSLLSQLAGQALELIQGGIDADKRELGLDYPQVEVPDVGEDAAHPSGRVIPPLAGVPGWQLPPRTVTRTAGLSARGAARRRPCAGWWRPCRPTP
jgi:hypothetical protein